MLLPEFKLFIDKYKNKNGFSWFNDYCVYIDRLSQDLKNNQTWMEDLNITKTIFNKNTTSKRININDCDISLPIVSSGGKRPFEYKIYGFCGSKANPNNFKKTTKDDKIYYLLPLVTLHYDNKYTISLNLHKYVTCENKEGYEPGKSNINSCLRDIAKRILQRNGFIPNNNFQATLNIYKSETKSIFVNNTTIVNYKQINSELNHLLEVIKEIQKDPNYI